MKTRSAIQETVFLNWKTRSPIWETRSHILETRSQHLGNRIPIWDDPFLFFWQFVIKKNYESANMVL